MIQLYQTKTLFNLFLLKNKGKTNKYSKSKMKFKMFGNKDL